MRPARLALAIVAAYVGTTVALFPESAGGLGAVLLGHPFSRAMGLMGLLAVGLGVVTCRLRVGGDARSGWRAGIALARREGWFSHRPAAYAVVIFTLPVFFAAFATMKTLVVPPFTWDGRLARLDLVLHRSHPWQLVPCRPDLTAALHFAYYLWWYLVAGIVLWWGWTGSAWERGRFWLAFVLTWIVLGTILASLVPSAGPLFYHRATGEPGPYVDLLAYLHRVEAGAGLGMIAASEALWRAVTDGEIIYGGGVSAFPSLHVAMPMLGACSAWRTSRAAVVAGLAVTLVIFCGSVALGWHYALDGYASILLVPAIWWLSGKVR